MDEAGGLGLVGEARYAGEDGGGRGTEWVRMRVGSNNVLDNFGKRREK